MEKLNFHIITPYKGPKEWLDDCISSVRSQTLPNVHHVIIDDESKGACRNHFETLQKIEPVSSNIIIHLDGDDMFLGTRVLETIAEAYQDQSVWATYGNYVSRQGSVCMPDDSIPYRESFRKVGWRWSHPRTFRAHLIPYLQEVDMKDSKGCWFTSTADVAIFLPILELCGKSRVKFINKDLIYYRIHPNNDHASKQKLQDQIRCAYEIFYKKTYLELL